MLQHSVINVGAIDLAPIGWELIPYIFNPENSQLQFGRKLLLQSILHWLWMHIIAEPEQDVDFPLVAYMCIIQAGKIIALIYLLTR